MIFLIYVNEECVIFIEDETFYNQYVYLLNSCDLFIDLLYNIGAINWALAEELESCKEVSNVGCPRRSGKRIEAWVDTVH